MDTSPQPDRGESGDQQRQPVVDTGFASLLPDKTRDAEFHEPGFAHIDGDVGGSGYNETNVDVVAVPCPGADPLRPWVGADPFPDGYFSPPSGGSDLNLHPAIKELAGDAILSPGINMNLPKAAQVWVKQGIRKSASTARVLLYRHGTPSEDTTLESLAEDLMVHVMKMREGLDPSRPLFFVAHSIGGLVVKILLLNASKTLKYRTIMYNCHGVAFFGTPHRGSSYLSMSNLSQSIMKLLSLERPLPRSIADELSLGHKPLLKLNDEFRDISSELRIWTFYETLDSQLSGTGAGQTTEVQFGAPLVSIKSSILDIWQEDVFSVDCDHANCASFGAKNPSTLACFLVDFSAAIAKAEQLSKLYVHHPMHLKDHVKVDLIGFYEDPDAELERYLRLYFTKVSLAHFLLEGPEKCLEERLRIPGQSDSPHDVRPTTSGSAGEGTGLGILSTAQSVSTHPPGETQADGAERPDIVVTQPAARPSASAGATSHSMPAAAMRRLHSLTVPHGPNEHRRPVSRASNASNASTLSEPIPDVSPEGHEESHRHHAPHRQESSDLKRLALQALGLGFARPDPNKRKFMWIHLPFNNPLWVKNIFDTMSRTHLQNFSRLFNNEYWLARQVQGHPSQRQPNYVKPACNIVTADSPHSPRPSPSPSGRSSPASHTPDFLYLYMPYLHFDTYANIIRRRDLIKRRLDHGRAGPVPAEIAHLESMELRVVWEYIGADPPLNCRRTLDQFGYPLLQDTDARDDDQMLHKLTKKQPSKSRSKRAPGPERADTFASKISSMMSKDDESSSESDSGSGEDDQSMFKDGNLLMVDQLWLWAIDTTNLVTFFPKRESSPKEGNLFQQADLRNSVYNELNGDLTGHTENALDLAAFIVLHAVTVLLNRSSHPDLEVFRIFEEAIGMLTERMTTSLKLFRAQTYKDLVAGISTSLSDSDSDVGTENTKSIKRRYKHELERAQRENRENTSALLELRDMEDELITLGRLFDSQESVVKSMLAIYTSPSLQAITVDGQSYLNLALRYLDSYKSTVAEMKARVDTTRKDYEKLLEMAQRQAQVDDVRWSRIQTELASSQNLSVMIFTIFTVIFLPLSFFTGVFGMNTIEWQDDNVPSLRFIGSIALPVSVFVIVGSLVAAFSERVQGWFFFVFRHWKRLLKWWRAQVTRMTPQKLEARRTKRRMERERRARREERKRREKRSYDFWASMMKEREEEDFAIPQTDKQVGGRDRDAGAGADAKRRDPWKEV